MADTEAAGYYGLPVSTEAGLQQAAIYPTAAADSMLTTTATRPYDRLPLPDVIVLSKPEIYDPRGDVRAVINQGHYHCTGSVQAFEIFEK